MKGLSPGFADPVLDAQRSFRALLDAMSRPGRVMTIEAGIQPPSPLSPAAGAVLLTLVDADTSLWLDPSAKGAAADWLRFHAGCPIVEDPGAAAFAWAPGETAPSLSGLHPGTEEEPEGAATLVIQVEALEESSADGWSLTGPGIKDVHRLRVRGAPAGFAAAWRANRARFPRGVDVVLCAGDAIAALPRTVAIEEG